MIECGAEITVTRFDILLACAFLVDLDGDGDMDIATTEENGGWGVIWFENPSKK